MTAPQPAASPSKSFLRTLAGAAVLGLILFAVLWYAVFSAVTAALIAAGGTGFIIAGSSVSDFFESLLAMLASVLLAVIGAIATVFTAIFSIFD